LQVACEIHPINNLRVLQYLQKRLAVSDEQKTEWYRHWVDAGFASLEAKLNSDQRTGRFIFGNIPTIADLCLVPQVWNARRFEIPLNSYPTIARVSANAMELEAFQQAEPANQPDAE
jgi:maleylacetoacetate isomerase